MSIGEIFGYIASVLVFAAFYMKTMLPLRVVAIGSNIAFIIYALWAGLTPILILHVLLLPLNTLRLLQLRRLSEQLELAARGSFSINALIPLMRRRSIAANQTLFSAGDPANELYYIVEGVVFLPELQREVGPGSFLGEFAIFSDDGRRTAGAIARTDVTFMSLSRSGVFAALIQQPRLGIYLLKLVTTRFLQNIADQPEPSRTAAVAQLSSLATPPERVPSRLHSGAGRWAVRAAVIASVAAILALELVYHPVYTLLYRDAVVTTWLNVVAAPISGTIEGFDVRPGQTVAPPGTIGRIVDHSIDRSAVIRAEAAARRASARLAELVAYEAKITTLSSEWQDRKALYADGFRRDLDLKITELERRSALLQERVDFADASAKRKRTLRTGGNVSQADEEAAASTHRELLASHTDATMDLERLRHRRELAGRGIFLQEDGKEPEWSWRSLDELRLELTRTTRTSREAIEEVNTLQSTLESERKNLAASADATFTVQPGMRIWSLVTSNGVSVTRGQRLFTWIDCSKLLLDVPVNDTLATLVREGTRATVSLDGENVQRPAVVVTSRGSASRLGKDELVSIAEWRQSSSQVIVALTDSAAVGGCPIGRRAFVSFPDLTFLGFLRAYLPIF